MADIQIAGIMRAGAYSPNHIGNDAAIFNAAAEQLRIPVHNCGTGRQTDRSASLKKAFRIGQPPHGNAEQCAHAAADRLPLLFCDLRKAGL